MNRWEKYRMDVSELDLKLEWEENELDILFSENELDRIDPDRYKDKKNDRSFRVLGLFLIFVFVFFILSFFPIYGTVTELERRYPSMLVYISIVFFSFYIVWISSVFLVRYHSKQREGPQSSKFVEKINRITQSFSLSDIIPLVIYFTFIIASLEEMQIFNFSTFIININISSVEAFLQGSTPNLIGVITLIASLAFLGQIIVIQYIIWINPPEKRQKLVEYCSGKELIFLHKSSEVRNPFHISWILTRKMYLGIPVISRSLLKGIIKRSEVKISSIPYNSDIKKIWNFLFPYYFPQLYWVLLTDSIFLAFGFDLLYKAQGFTNYASIIIIIIIMVLFVLLFFNTKELGLDPLIKYHRLRKLLLKRIIQSVDLYYKDISEEEEDFNTIELIFLTDCLNRIKSENVLPFNKSLITLLFAIPFVSQILAIWFSFL
ncbi:MAG: hypothetical protein EAX86_09570 [Candidatus Heimdallarchaeota archaeon]|nr:hypothetical protein [Candidatus Heimdallarchaeota archaeon]